MQIAEESYENAPLLSSMDEVDSAKARNRSSSSKSPPGSASYSRQNSARYTKDPCSDDREAWPEKRPPPVPTAATPGGGKGLNDSLPKTDKDGYLETSFADDRCSGYLDAVEPVHQGNRR